MSEVLITPAPPKAKSTNAARRTQLQTVCRHAVPNLYDFKTFCQIRYFRAVTIYKYFLKWADATGTPRPVSTGSKPPEFLFGECGRENDKVEIPWERLQNARPHVRMPRRDSTLRGFLRKLVPPAVFHKLQQTQSQKKMPRKIVAPNGCDTPLGGKDLLDLVVDLVNYANSELDMCNMWYERYLDYFEYQMGGEAGDEINPMIVMYNVAEISENCDEREQVMVVVGVADSILEHQMDMIMPVE